LAEYVAKVETFLAFQSGIVEVFDSLSTTEEKQSRLTQEGPDGEYGILRQGLSYSAGAWAVITYTCGPDDDINAERHGYGRLTALMTDQGFAEIFWGEFVDCAHYNGETKAMTLSGRLAVHSADFAGEALLVSIIGTIDTGDGPTSLDDDFQFEDGAIRMIRTVRAQNFVVGINPSNSLSISIRDCSGDWSCIVEDSTCAFAAATGECAPEAQAVSW